MELYSSTSAYKRLLHSLSKPSPASCTTATINFVKAGLPIYKDFFAILINDALSSAECQEMLAAAEATNNHVWDQALVNIGNGEQALYTDARLCDRIIWDDEAISAKIMDRILPHLPDNIVTLRSCGRITGHGPVKWNETWKLSRLNERMRFLRYTKGMYFRPHCDANYATPNREAITYLTAHLYLNGDQDAAQTGHEVDDDNKKPLQGGATRFMDLSGKDEGLDVNPKTGSILVFQQRNLVHSGEDVIQGTKYTMRSDILYKKVEDTP